MTRAHLPPAAKAAAAQHYLTHPELADPLEPLLDAVQEALVRHVTLVSKQGGGSALRVEKVELAVVGGEALHLGQPIAKLRSALGHVVADALRSSIGAHTAEGKRLRLLIARKLLTIEVDEPSLEFAELPEDRDDAWLKTADVAAQLGTSRPYVSMLCDSGKLGEVSRTEGGHRRIQQSAVTAYLAAQKAANSGGQSPRSPREAAMAAGMYAVSDAAYAKAARRPPAKRQKQSAQGKAKPGRAAKT